MAEKVIIDNETAMEGLTESAAKLGCSVKALANHLLRVLVEGDLVDATLDGDVPEDSPRGRGPKNMRNRKMRWIAILSALEASNDGVALIPREIAEQTGSSKATINNDLYNMRLDGLLEVVSDGVIRSVVLRRATRKGQLWLKAARAGMKQEQE